jgi:anti-sigma B factor antagonist
MDINVRTTVGITVVELAGELTWQSAPDAQRRILEQAHSEARICLDMSRVTYMASAGLRMLLSVYRFVTGQGGRVLLVGLPEEIRDTMALTGFLDFFEHRDTSDTGIAELTS